ncbi:flagellin N-terminal helical domain-containing protein [Clostridium botulinum]|uniref:Flagellin n=7 Tax=Clostridium botulinum TaxID=1491 RepID=A5I5G4_CLOBH|nr:flagellin [Clostridium botulinum]ABI50022.1 FlaA [Clostridium botulinum]ABI50024.1 FlaA [Clostridium botulinum]ABS35292.1 flagellin [Clostridium botulinum A str. ATCC 19397]ABS38875.1 flagellin [Clostridium botulinum A str. Hall]ACO86118.1 flagellin [Clostridium botulinum A2 str. Kyoto]
MIINHNLNAMNAHRQMAINTGNNGKAIEKLSSGLRINRAGDDAAGLAISEKMRGQIRGLNQASRNSQDAISLIQTAEGALNETHSILQRMRELTVQAANDTNVTVDRENLQKEVAELQSEINRISSQTQFNTKSLINGAVSKDADAMTFQIGANSGQTIKLTIGSMDAKTLNVDKIKLDDTAANVTKQIATIDNAINSVSKERAKLGANQNRLEHTIANLDNSAENLQAAESRIRDVDMAKEMMNFTKTNILTQAAQAMLAQANQAPQGVLQLLR